MRGLDGLTDIKDIRLVKLQEMVRERDVWHAAVHGLKRVGHDWVTEQQQNRYRGIQCSWIGRINIVKMIILPKAAQRFSAISLKLSMAFSTR